MVTCWRFSWVPGAGTSGGELPQFAADDVLAAHVALILAHVEGARHGGAHAVGGRTGGAPAVRHGHDLLPILRALRDVGGVVDLVELGRVFRDKTVWLDEVG